MIMDLLYCLGILSEKIQKKNQGLAGLEPAISSSGGIRHIH